MARLLTALLLALTPSLANAWSACGHHTVALIAYDLLSEDDQARLRELLAEHPRFAEDFEPSPKVRDKIRFQVGTAGYWPDIARSQPEYNRSKWHYEPGPTLTIGNVTPIDRPGPLPADATLETRDLHLSQAVALCRRVMADTEQPASDRAIALSWLAHLVGDAHQPCHAGSLYVEGVFEQDDGDRGANRIELTRGRNLHSLWDGLLGRSFSENRVRREVFEIGDDPRFIEKAEDGADELDPQAWLEESRAFSKRFTYRPEVLGPIRAASEGRAESLPKLSLSDDYLTLAGTVARIRVAQAGYRLAGVWRECLKSSPASSAAEEEQDLSLFDSVRPPRTRRTRVEPSSEAPGVKVWVTDTGEKYHREDCRFCDKSGVAIDLDAVRGRMEPCKVCRPPE